MVNFKGNVLTETTLYILSALKNELHGYGIIKSVEDMTEGRIILGPGTLYGALKTLEQNGAIETVGAPEGGRNKKNYRRTAYGSELLKSELTRLNELILNIEKSLPED